MMKPGFFNDETKEYIIKDPRTPVKWINYIGTLGFGGFVDQNGGGVVCKGDPALNRITKYIPQLPSSDMNGETLYIRVKTKSGYKLFSPFYTPVLKELDSYECRVGLGYTRIIAEKYSVRVDITIFVPIKGQQVIRKIKIENLSNKAMDIDIIPVIEYTHFDALKQFTNADWIPQTMQSRRVKTEDGTILLKQYAFMNRDTSENYFTSNYPASSFETDRKNFLGNNGYGSWNSPESLKNLELTNIEANRGDNIAAIMHHIVALEPQDSRLVITQLGQYSKIEDALDKIEKYKKPEIIEKELESMKSFWDEHLSKMQVSTPDASMNTMLNIHNPRQCYITKNWSRYLSLYQLGLGARGLGFRDSSQDVMGILGNAPEEGRFLIEKLLHVQKSTGQAMHQFNPLTMVANEGDSREEEDRPHYYGDDHLWVILAICAYIKETGNIDFLEKEIPFYEKDKNGEPLYLASVKEHIEKGISFTWENRGQHGLPLLGFADWNDCVNLKTGAESLFVANLFGVALREYTDILAFMKKEDEHKNFSDIYKEMKTIVNNTAWDGEWFVRYFDYNGDKVGSKENQYGSIYTNAQSWSVLSGFAESERAETAMDSVRNKLNTSKGIKLSWPGYNGYDKDMGGITTYPPGAKENGGIFLHTNPWVMIAETMLGRGDYAFEYYNQINPASKNDIIDEYECEPYCYVQNILGNEHPQFGLGRNSWLSGTSSWTYQAATKYILGIRPACEGLIIDPCIPKSWKGFKVKRIFRGISFDITIENPKGVSKGVEKILFDGLEIKGNIIPVSNSSEDKTNKAKNHQIHVYMA